MQTDVMEKEFSTAVSLKFKASHGRGSNEFNHNNSIFLWIFIINVFNMNDSLCCFDWYSLNSSSMELSKKREFLFRYDLNQI